MAACDATTITNLSGAGNLNCTNDPMIVAATLDREVSRAIAAGTSGSFKDGGLGGVDQMQRLAFIIRTIEGLNNELIARAAAVIANQHAFLVL